MVVVSFSGWRVVVLMALGNFTNANFFLFFRFLGDFWTKWTLLDGKSPWVACGSVNGIRKQY